MGDYDNDGRANLSISNMNERLSLLRNTLAAGEVDHSEARRAEDEPQRNWRRIARMTVGTLVADRRGALGLDLYVPERLSGCSLVWAQSPGP